MRALLYLLGRVDEEPLALILAARTLAAGGSPPVEALAAHPGALVRELTILDEGAVAALVVRRLPDADSQLVRRCAQLAAGNPLYLRELLYAVTSQGETVNELALIAATELAARSIGRSVMARLRRMSPGAQELAKAVAILDHDVPLGQAAALARLDEAEAIGAAEELIRGDVLASSPTLTFTHPLLRSAVYAQLAPWERAEQHGAAAALVQQSGASTEKI